MPNHVTARLFLEDRTKGLGETRETVGALYLNEGYDKPFWATEGPHPKKVIPAAPGTMLVDGLVMLFQEFTDFEPKQDYLRLKSSAHELRQQREAFEANYTAAAFASLSEATNSLEISLMVYQDAGFHKQLGELKHLPGRVNLFLE